ncbi:hypothetical protein BOVATA_001360 [Babesia ovata]|uniref:Uncharacterized protein n=1 Tax=Babesia ovata TaxID=189622 RepID=A0A2H6K6L6_9APIC|nr:uncharacterized protein BOVATA_001360 [Babesia ovata]GBE58643.1 hypothetical protein BOVATA_001360 [Babesia ovata]
MDIGAVLTNHAAVVKAAVSHLLTGDLGSGFAPRLVAYGAEPVVVELKAASARARGHAGRINQTQGAEGDAIMWRRIGAFDNDVILVRLAVHSWLFNDAARYVILSSQTLRANVHASTKDKPSARRTKRRNRAERTYFDRSRWSSFP